MLIYKNGNLFDNLSKDKKNVILHICNDSGGWGSGFVLAVNKYCGTKPRANYRKWFVESFYVKNNYQVPFKLGQIQVSETEDSNVFVVNMVAQSTPGGVIFNIGNEKIRLPPIRYQSLEECLYRVKELFNYNKELNIVGPKFGAGLAGGNWNIIEKIIAEVGLDITIWEL